MRINYAINQSFVITSIGFVIFCAIISVTLLVLLLSYYIVSTDTKYNLIYLFTHHLNTDFCLNHHSTQFTFHISIDVPPHALAGVWRRGSCSVSSSRTTTPYTCCRLGGLSGVEAKIDMLVCM